MTERTRLREQQGDAGRFPSRLTRDERTQTGASVASRTKQSDASAQRVLQKQGPVDDPYVEIPHMGSYPPGSSKIDERPRPVAPRRSATTGSAPSSRHHEAPSTASRHHAGHFAGLHPEDQPYQTGQPWQATGYGAWLEEPDDEEERSSRHSTRRGTSARHLGLAPYRAGSLDRMEQERPPRRRYRLHWLARLGITLTLVLLGWLLLSEAATWTQHALDRWHYGYPPTYQTDAVVGHADSLAHPSHFLALNLDGHLEVIELSGGDPRKAHLYVGPTLSGDGRDEVPVTLRFQDENGNGKPDLVIEFHGVEVVYRNTGTSFQPPSHP